MVKEETDLTRRVDASITGTLDSVIQEVAWIITSTLDINEVYEKFALEVKKLVDFDRIYINVMDREAGAYSLKYIFGLIDPAHHNGDPKLPEGTQTQVVVDTGLPLVRPDIAADLRRFIDDQQNLNLGLRSSIALPLVSKGKAIGTLGLRSCQIGAYGPNEQIILERLANLIAPAVENAELYQRLQASAQEMALVDEVARIITSTLEIDQVYEKFAQEMKKLVGFDRASIHVIDQEESAYTLRYLFGPARPEHPLGVTRRLEGTQNEWVLATGETLRRDDIANDLKFITDQGQLELGMRASIAVPLVSKGRVIGVMALRSRKVGAFGAREQVILERLGRQVAPAVENAELYQQRKEAEEAERLQTQQMEALYTIASMLVQPGSFEEKCNDVLEVLTQTAQADAAALRAVDEKDMSLHFVAAVNPGNVSPPPSPYIRCGEGVAGSALQEGQPIVTNGYATHPKAIERGKQRGVKSLVALPIKIEAQTLGVITVVSKEANHFTPELVRLLSAIADGLGMLLENSRLSQDLRASAREMAVVDEVARIITSTLDINQVYEKFALEMRKLVEFDRASISFADQEVGTYTLLYHFGESRPGHPIGVPTPLEGTYTQRVVKTGRSLITEDIAKDAEYPPAREWIKLGFRSNIIVPLISKSRAIGTLSLRSRQVGAFGAAEQTILERLAHQIAPAVENARLYQQLQTHTEEMAVVDEVARIITSTLEIDQVCEEFTQEMRKLVDFERAAISVIDQGTDTFTVQYLFGDPRSGHPVGSVMPLTGNLTGELVKTGQTIVCADIAENQSDVDDRDHLKLGLRSCIALPLISKGQVIGSLILRSRQVEAYGPREQAILERLTRQIAPAIENAQLYKEASSEKERATTTLAQFKAVLSGVDMGILLVGNDQEMLWANQRFGEFFGFEDIEPLAAARSPQQTRRQLMRKALAHPGQVFAEFDRIYEDRSYAGASREIEIIHPTRRILQPFTTPVYDDEGEYVGRLWVHHDITERKTTEEQILQFQKIESIGRLAGGIAHDFNNVLTAIIGYSQLAMLEVSEESNLCNHVQEIQKAAERAANLTSQLLAFSRRQVVEPKVINLNHLILNLDRLLRRLIGEDIELITLPSPDLGPVKVDPNQMEQVLVNLAVNARDAMPAGGKLVIETGSVILDARYAQQHAVASPGQYALLSVTDTGEGMSEEVKAHLFEPFFTTKEVGKGTGLGLATCYGIIKQNGGHIEVQSELGQGTSVKVYLPYSKEFAETYVRDEQAYRSTRGTETILLAEDDPLVRSMVAKVLRDQGYQVLQAATGDEALRLAQEYADKGIDLLLTDVVMPHMGGVELADRLNALRPETKVIFTSGYTDEPIIHEGMPDSSIEFIQKPFIPAVLAMKVRDVLDKDRR